MKYFIDTEFIEGFNKPLFGKKRHFIDLISIGIVCEDGRSLYRISSEFNPKDADKWVKDNVISKLQKDYMNLRSNKEIVRDIKEFMGYKPEWTDYGSDEFTNDKNIEIYAYYADYDWVLFCSLFGRMIDLPKGMPMYCKDLKQIFDEKIHIKCRETVKQSDDYPKQLNAHNALDDARWNRDLYNYLELFDGNS
jgi:hypothetical protein